MNPLLMIVLVLTALGPALSGSGSTVAASAPTIPLHADNPMAAGVNEEWSIVGYELATTQLPGHIGDAAFARTWSRTDLPVADGHLARTWMWGPGPLASAFDEVYAESPGGMRLIQYFDKSRMEITFPDGDDRSVWYVTNGLLATELISGQMQTGDTAFEERSPAMINVAGDPGDLDTPTYATLTDLLAAAPYETGSIITSRLHRQGTVTDDPNLDAHGVTVAVVDDVTGHAIAAPFWAFMTAAGLVYEDGQFIEAQFFPHPVYATGRPITEAYWTTVAVGGTPKDVLLQCFERRCLTYTPDNSEGWQVEAGNIGQHYFRWRYGSLPYAAGLAFSSDRSGNGYIYRFDHAYYRIRQLTNQPDSDYVPAWSPDGSRIAFIRQTMDGSASLLMTMDLYGELQTAVLSRRDVIFAAPVWSPDGSRIVFLQAEPLSGLGFSLWVIDVDGSNLTRLTPEGMDVDLRPTWSPDGTKLAVSGHRTGDVDSEIYVVNSDGTGLTNLTNSDVNENGPSWSPDGEWIAFLADLKSLPIRDVSIIRPDGGGVRRLTMVPTEIPDSPSWSPDSSQLAYVSWVEGYLQVFTIKIDGSDFTAVTDSNDGRLKFDPQWSPDGRWIAFTAFVEDENFEVFVVQPDGTGLINLTSDPADDSDPSWAGGGHNDESPRRTTPY